jgi:ATP-dependent RNA helicase RhlE
LAKLLLEAPPKDQKTLIFCNRLGSCKSLEGWISSVPEVLEMMGGPKKFAILHNRVPREQRAEVLQQFKEGSLTTLLCTDLVSRGMDIEGVQHVILYDFPKSIVDYLHRVGRTARYGASGRATSFVGKYDEKLANEIKKASSK